MNLREDALDREATLMNVLKSVNNKSEPDIVEASKETTEMAAATVAVDLVVMISKFSLEPQSLQVEDRRCVVS